jgi:putative ABC transport system permease protein
LPMLLADLKIAIRYLLKSPGFTGTAILMLAFGIGTTTSIFSLFEGVLLRPLPFPDPGRLMVLSDVIQGAEIRGNAEAGVTAPDIRNYMRGTHSFESLGGYQQTSYELAGAGDPAVVNAPRMSSTIFAALGVQPQLGRVFTQQEDDEGEQLVVLSYATWQDRFHRDPHVMGRKVLLERKPYVVIGVMPRGFEFPLLPGQLNRNELWVPLSLKPQELTAGAASWTFHMVGRLKPGVSAAQAISDAARVAEDTVRNYPAFMSGFRILPVVRQLQEETVEEARPLVRMLFLAVAVVLLIACANLAGLLLVRAIRRRHEVAVRLALGAHSLALVRQVMLESLVLSMTGGLVGLALAAAMLRIGVGLLPETLPRIGELGLDLPVVGFALCLALATGIICGLAPAFAAMRTTVNDMLRDGGRTASRGGHGWLRSGLVIAEIAVAMVLLVTSGLLLRSFEKMRQVDPGFKPDHTLVASYALPRQQYATRAEVGEFDDELVRRLQELPGVKNVGLSTVLPASDDYSDSEFTADGSLPRKEERLDLANIVMVEGDYFRAMGLSLLRGRLFTPADKDGSQLVVIVNHKLAEESWPGQNPIGKRLREGTQSMQMPWATVVGEVADVKERSPDSPAIQQFYMPVRQAVAMAGSLAFPTYLPGNAGYIVLRTSVFPDLLENPLRATVRSVDPQLPVMDVQTMGHEISDSEAPRRFNTVLISSFALAALLLAIMGIYSVVAFSVALRSHEIAIRMLLGLPRRGVVRLILASGGVLATTGCFAGLAGAMAVAHLLRSFLFGVSAVDPLVLALAALLVLILALAASLPPAFFACSVDPLKVLRQD